MADSLHPRKPSSSRIHHDARSSDDEGKDAQQQIDTLTEGIADPESPDGKRPDSEATDPGQPTRSKQQHPQQPWLASLAILLAIGLTAVVVNVATFSHAQASTLQAARMGAILVAIGCVPPLWLPQGILNAPTQHLILVAWRFATLAPAFFLMNGYEVAERNCFLTTLLACYFVALPLESWLLIREVRHSDD